MLRQPRPTHFLSIPLKHIDLRMKLQSFGESLLAESTVACSASTPATLTGSEQVHNPRYKIDGMDPSIVIDPRRLHFTLGVMALDRDNKPGTTKERDTPRKTVEEAHTFLASLGPQLQTIIRQTLSGKTTLNKVQLTVKLDTMSILKPARKGEYANVVWIGPSDSEDETAFASMCNFVNKAFRDAGFITEERPLKLHCTIINSVYRKRLPGTTEKRYTKSIPFSWKEVRAAAETWTTPTDAKGNLVTGLAYISKTVPPAETQSEMTPASLRIDFGTYEIDGIQLCEMGSGGRGADGGYVCVAGVPLAM